VENQGAIDFNFVLETPDGAIPEMRIKIPDRAIKLCDLAPFMHTLTNAIIDLAVNKSADRGEKITCEFGCGVCCRQLVPLSAPEVFFIIDQLIKMPLAERIPVLKRFEIIERRAMALDLKTRILSPAGTETDNKAVARDYFHLLEACPFQIAQSCSIYTWRPVVCREFNALSDPALCQDPFVNKVRTVPLFKRPSSVLSLLASRVSGISPALVPMPLMFDWYERNKGLGDRTWPAEMLIRKLLEIIVEPGIKNTMAKAKKP
jgi:Fe-S-cluster containining protein